MKTKTKTEKPKIKVERGFYDDLLPAKLNYTDTVTDPMLYYMGNLEISGSSCMSIEFCCTELVRLLILHESDKTEICVQDICSGINRHLLASVFYKFAVDSSSSSNCAQQMRDSNLNRVSIQLHGIGSRVFCKLTFIRSDNYISAIISIAEDGLILHEIGQLLNPK